MWFKLRTLGDNHEQSLDTCCLSLTCISIIWPLVGTASMANFWHFVQVCMSLAQSLQYRIFAWTFQKDWSSDGGFLAPSKTLQAKNTTLSARRKIVKRGLQTAVGQFEPSESSVSVPESLSDVLIDLVEALKRCCLKLRSRWSTEHFMTLHAVQSNRTNQHHPIIQNNGYWLILEWNSHHESSERFCESPKSQYAPAVHLPTTCLGTKHHAVERFVQGIGRRVRTMCLWFLSDAGP